MPAPPTGFRVPIPTPPVPLAMSPDRTQVKTAGVLIIDDASNSWMMTDAGQIAFNGTAIPWTRNAIGMDWIAGVIWYRTTHGDWFSVYRDLAGDPAPGLGPMPLGPDAAADLAPVTITIPYQIPITPLVSASAGAWTRPRPNKLPSEATIGNMTLPSGARSMHYNLLPPDSYDPSRSYPLVVYLHDNQAGTDWYNGRNADFVALTASVDPWFNGADFRAAYPAVIVCPYCDQSTDATGSIQNWRDPANAAGVIAVIDQVCGDYAIDQRRVYVTGDGMGGDGAWALALTDARVAAAVPMSGSLEGDPTADEIRPLTSGDVAVFAVTGTLNPVNAATWSRRVWEMIAGNIVYPAPPGDTSGSYTYLEDTSVAGDVWNTYRADPVNNTAGIMQWLFAQLSAHMSVDMPLNRWSVSSLDLQVDRFGATPDLTTIPPAATIIDQQRHVWSISAGHRAEMDGDEDQTTDGIIELAWISGFLWSLDYHGRWRRKASASAPWDPPAGRLQSPLVAPARPLVNGGIPLAAAGTWAGQILTAGGITQHYAVLLPHGYNPAHSWRVIVLLHDHLSANSWYADAIDEVTPVFAALNTPEFRSAYPAILIAPFCDQRDDLTGQTVNFGGITPARQRPEVNIVQFISTLRTRASVSNGRVFTVGIGAMGGAAAWAWQLRYPELFAGAMIFDGSPTEFGLLTPPIIESLRDRPLWISHGFRDATVLPKAWSEPLYTALGGTTPARGARSPNGAMYLNEPIAGHGTWVDGLGLPSGKLRWDSLFSR